MYYCCKLSGKSTFILSVDSVSPLKAQILDSVNVLIAGMLNTGIIVTL